MNLPFIIIGVIESLVVALMIYVIIDAIKQSRQNKQPKMTEAEQKVLADQAFETFANCYPHEAHEMDNERFMKYATKETGLPEAEILEILEETNQKPKP